MTDKEALLALKHGREVDQKTLIRFAQQGLVNVQDVTDHDTPPSLKGYIFLHFTMKGRDLLESPSGKLESAHGYPTKVMHNGVTTKFVRNVTPDGVYQIAEIIGAGDYLLLFSGKRDDGEEFLQRKIEKEYPGLMNPPFP